MICSLLTAAVVHCREFRTSSDRGSKPHSVAAYERVETAHTVHTGTTKGLIRISNFAQSIGATEGLRSMFTARSRKCGAQSGNVYPAYQDAPRGSQELTRPIPKRARQAEHPVHGLRTCACQTARRGLGYFGKTSRDMGVRSYLEDSLARRPDGRILNSARSV